MSPRLLNFPMKILQENQNCFKLQSCTWTKYISGIFVYWSKNSISQFDKQPIQLNKYNRYLARTHRVSYSTREHGNEYRRFWKSTKRSQSVVLHERLMHGNVWYCLSWDLNHIMDSENMFVVEIYMKLIFEFPLLQSTRRRLFTRFNSTMTIRRNTGSEKCKNCWSGLISQAPTRDTKTTWILYVIILYILAIFRSIMITIHIHVPVFTSAWHQSVLMKIINWS